MVGKDMGIDKCKNLKELPDDLKVGGYIYLGRTNLTERPIHLRYR